MQTNLEIIINSTQWIFLGEGAFNRAYVSKNTITIEGYSSRWVLKKPSKTCHQNDINRATKKWKLHNPEYPVFKTDNGWLTPYFGNTPASDEQTALKLIETYQKTGNIIVDGCGKMNILVYQDKLICIDMDYSFRRGSFSSDKFLSDKILWDRYLKYWDEYAIKHRRSKSVSVIRTLLYLETELPNNDKYQYMTPRLTQLLSVFFTQKQPITMVTMDLLLEIIRLDPNHEIKDKSLSPQFIQNLQPLLLKQSLSKELIVNLINEQLLIPSEFTKIIKDGFLDEVQFIIQNNPLLMNAPTEIALTPLEIAAKHGHAEVLHYFLDQQEIIVAPASNGKLHAIHSAASHGLLDCVERLVKHNPALIDVLDSHGQSPLLFAARSGHHATLQYLVSKAANVNLASQYSPDHKDYHTLHNLSPLDWAIRIGQSSTALILLSENARANKTHENFGGQSLQQLIFSKHLNGIKALLKHNPSLINKPDQDGVLPLNRALTYGTEEIACYILNEGAIISPAIQGKLHEVHIAASRGLLNCVAHFVEHNPNLAQIPDNRKRTPFYFAARYGFDNVMQFLMTQNVNVNLAIQYPLDHHDYQTLHNLTPLDMAIKNGFASAAFILMQAGAQANLTHEKFNEQSLHTLISTGDLDGIKILIQHNPSLINILNAQNHLPLEMALHYNDTEMELYLISKGAVVSSAIDGKTHIIHVAAAQGSLNCVQRLIQYNNELIHVLNENMETPLFLAAKNGHVDICSLLLQNGANPRFENKDGKTAEEFWCTNFPLKKNPFSPYTRLTKLEIKQLELEHLVNEKISRLSTTKWFNNYSVEKAILMDLKNKIQKTTFTETDNEDRTASDVLRDTINRWNNYHTRLISINRHMFFSQSIGLSASINETSHVLSELIDGDKTAVYDSLFKMKNIT